MQPHLGYATQVCNPQLKSDKQLMEQPPEKAIECVCGYGKVPYPERLHRLGIYPTTYPLLCGDLILTYSSQRKPSLPKAACDIQEHQTKWLSNEIITLVQPPQLS